MAAVASMLAAPAHARFSTAPVEPDPMQEPYTYQCAWRAVSNHFGPALQIAEGYLDIPTCGGHLTLSRGRKR